MEAPVRPQPWLSSAAVPAGRRDGARRLTHRVRTTAAGGLWGTLPGLRIALWVAAWLCLRAAAAPAAELRDSCEEPGPSWVAVFDANRVTLLRHRRDSEIAHDGKRSEQFVFRSAGGPVSIQLRHELPAARLIEDLRASVWVLGNRPGLQVALRVVLPHQRDSTSGQPTAVWIRGDKYDATGQWQRLSVRMDPQQFADELLKLRARLRPTRVDDRDAYVAGLALLGEAAGPQTTWHVDELVVQGLVATSPPETDAAAETPQDFPVRFHLDRLLIDRRPVLPRIVVDHGEPPERFRELGANLVLVPPETPVERLFALRDAGLWAMAVPPPPRRTKDGRLLGMAPFGRDALPIACWYFGTQLTEDRAGEVIEWIDAVRSADRRFQRPIAADIAGGTRRYTRHLSLTACSLPVLHSPTTLAEYAAWLNERRQRALPGSFLWTWVQTDVSAPAGPGVAHRRPHVEPEQIRLQTYAALAAGYRGIGFWSSRPLDDSTPLVEEQALAIRLLNYELELIEPFVASGTLADVLVPQPASRVRRSTAVRLGFLRSETALKEQLARLRVAQQEAKRSQHIAEQVRCGVIRSSHGLLLIPVWYEPGAQYTPGAMTARDVRFVVPGVADDAIVWQVSPTRLATVPQRRVAGGMEVTVPVLDQAAALVVTSDPGAIQRLRSRIAAIRARAAQAMLRLATLKRERVTETDALLARHGLPQPDGAAVTMRADEALQAAAGAAERASVRPPQQPSVAPSPLWWDQARHDAAAALQMLRILQRAHWEDAVGPLASPASSPYTLCFHTLPEHARLLARLGRTPWERAENRLPFGSFDPPEPLRMIEAGWEHTQASAPAIASAAELIRVAGGNYALRLWSVPAAGAGRDTPNAPAVVVVTPPIAVRSGQVIVVTGRIRVVRSITGHVRGAEISDNLSPPTWTLRYHRATDWQPFQLIRETARAANFRLTLRLWGTGEIQFDDLAAYVLTPNDARAQTP